MKQFLLVLFIFIALLLNSQSISVNPSPFNFTATANYTLVTNDSASIHIFNRWGQCIDTVLAWSFQVAGNYQKNIDLTGQPENIYVVLFKYGTKKQNFTVVNTTQPLGLKHHESSSDIILYPNPTKDFLTIPTQRRNATLTLTDSQGKVVYHFDGKMDLPSQIDLRFFSQGIYFLNLSQEGKQQIFKVVKD